MNVTDLNMISDIHFKEKEREREMSNDCFSIWIFQQAIFINLFYLQSFPIIVRIFIKGNSYANGFQFGCLYFVWVLVFILLMRWWSLIFIIIIIWSIDLGEISFLLNTTSCWNFQQTLLVVVWWWLFTLKKCLNVFFSLEIFFWKKIWPTKTKWNKTCY